MIRNFAKISTQRFRRAHEYVTGAAAKKVSQSRRSLCSAFVLWILAPSALAQSEGLPIEIWKSPSCSCCQDWIDYIEKSGFVVKVHESGNNAARRRLGLPGMYGSCHTALIAGYVVEGHVPVREIRRLLREKPDAVGIAVPAMPVGSPGMDGPAFGDRFDPYDVVLVARDGSARVYQSYQTKPTQ
jgi:hypothetical protein